MKRTGANAVLRKYRTLATLLLWLSVVFLILGFILPEYKTPQTFTASGPNVAFTPERYYWIDFHLIAPIEEGQQITLTLTSSKPGSTHVCLGPFNLQTSLFSGPMLVNEMLGQNKTEFVFVGRATRSGVYSLRITSWNSSYSVTVRSVWSPFYFSYRYVIVVAGALGVGSLLLLYYARVVEKPDRAVGGVHEAHKPRILERPITKLGDLESKAKDAIVGVFGYVQAILSRLATVGPYMIAVGLGATVLWGLLWLAIPSVNDSTAGLLVPLAILICFVSGVVLCLLGALANIAREL